MISWNIGSYWITEKGENCPVDLVVRGKPSCRDAAVALGKEHSSAYYDESWFPAGCFTTNSGIFFNHKLDPSSTSPDSDSAGICRSATGIVVNDHRV